MRNRSQSPAAESSPASIPSGALGNGDAPAATYIDRVIASEEFQRKAREAEAHWERHFRQYNPAFAEALELSAALRLMHAGNKP